MATLGGLRSTISERLRDPNNVTVKENLITEYVNESLRYWQRSEFWFNRGYIQVTVAGGSELVSGLPSDMLSGQGFGTFVLVKNNERYPIKQVTAREYDMYGRWFNDDPVFCMWRNGNYYLYPIPNVDIVLDVFYIKSYGDISDNLATNDFLENAYDLILYDTLARIYRTNRFDKESADACYSMVMLEEQSLEKVTAAKLGSEQVLYNTLLN